MIGIALLMPFPMKVQPIDCKGELAFLLAKPVAKSRLKRLFERQFLRSSSAEKAVCSGEGKDHADDVVSLDAMIVGYFEEGNHEKSPRGCSSCFPANFDGSDDDDDDCDTSGSAVHGDAVETIKVSSISASPLSLLRHSFELQQAFDGSSRVWCSAQAWRREISWRMHRGSSRKRGTRTARQIAERWPPDFDHSAMTRPPASPDGIKNLLSRQGSTSTSTW